MPSIRRFLRRIKGEHIDKGDTIVRSNQPHSVAKIIRTPNGFAIVGEKFIPHFKGNLTPIYPHGEKTPKKVFSQARNLRKRLRRNPSHTLHVMATEAIRERLHRNPSHVHPSRRAAHQAATEANYSHTRWNSKLQQCKSKRTSEERKFIVDEAGKIKVDKK